MQPDHRSEGDEANNADAAFERVARLAARALGVPFVLITLLDEERRFRLWSAGCEGAQVRHGDDLSFTLNLRLPSAGSGPPVSLCLTASSRQPSRSPHHLASPLPIGGGEPGAPRGEGGGLVCAGDAAIREWTDADEGALQDIAAIVSSEIELRGERAARQALAIQVERGEQIKSRWASTLRHEFGQPLTVIQGFSELMSEGDLSPDEVREYAHEIQKEAAHLSELVSRIRDVDQKVEAFAASFQG